MTTSTSSAPAVVTDGHVVPTGDVVADNLVAGRNGRRSATYVADDRDEPADRSQNAEAQVPLDMVEVWGVGSFPASDPPANW